MIKIPKQILDKNAVLIIPKDAIYTEENIAKVNSKKIVNYGERGYKGDEVLWIPPNDCFRAEFEDKIEVNKKFIAEMESNAKVLGFDYCITGHGGTSDYFNMFNIKGIPLTDDNQNAKLLLADLLMPKKAKDQLDRTNLGRTLSPVIEHEHWKPKYKGAIHKIVRGTNPLKHKNEYPNELLKQINKSKKENKKYIINTKQNNSWVDDFLLKYCCETLLPKGARHFIIEKNLAAYIIHRKDKEEIKERYYKAQERKHDSLRTWETAILKGNYTDVSAGEIYKFIKEYDISFKVKVEETKTGDYFTTKFQAENLNKLSPFFFDKQSLFWIWNNTLHCWEYVDDVDVLNMVEDTTQKDIISSKNRQEIINALKQIGRRNTPKEPPRTWIQFKDKIIDIKTGKIFEPTPEYFITNPIPWKMGEVKDTPNIDKIFEEWVGKNYVKTLKEIVAYTTLTYMPIHRVVCLDGDGSNGKGSFLRFIEKFVGKRNVTSSTIDKLTFRNFETSKLYKKLVCIIGEIGKEIFKRTDTLKTLTGDDLMGVEIKQKAPFDIHNYANPIIATNRVPKTADTSMGFFRRWTTIRFSNIFDETIDVLTRIPDEEYENFCCQVSQLIKDILKNGMFTNDGTPEERKEKYLKASSPIKEFLDECCDIGEDYECQFHILHYKYSSFLDLNNYSKESKMMFGKGLNDRGFERYNKNIGTTGGKTTESYRKGLKLKEES